MAEAKRKARTPKTPPDLRPFEAGLKPENDTDDVVALFGALSRTLNMNVCIHDRLGLASIPRALKEHINPACLHIKSKKQELCTRYDAVETHQALASRPEGRLNHCHAGFNEIVVPIYTNGAFIGVLFSGPFLLDGPPPPEIPENLLPMRAPSRFWVEDLRQLMVAAATRLGQILRPPEWPGRDDDRKAAIHRFVCSKFADEITLTSLARELHLSESRAGHLVKALFRMPLSELVESFRLRNAAEMLDSTDLPVSEIAFRSGFKDQNYFSRRFKKSFGQPPLAYRRKKRA